MKLTTIAILSLLFLVNTACSQVINRTDGNTESVCIDSLWNKDFNTAQDILSNFATTEKLIEGMSQEAHTVNMCHYIWQSGEYMFRCRGKNEDISQLPQNIERLELDDEIVVSFMVERDTARFVDHYFTLWNMKAGDSFEESRDGITITVFFHPRSINSNDYSKLREVFSSKNNALHIAYMKKLKFPFRNSGCNEEFYSIRPLIEKNVEESALKKEIISLFDLYRNIMPGEVAPTPKLKDSTGKEHTFAEFEGKVLVIDVWATWCSSCLKKMPDFIELRNRYKDNPHVEFITVSIDRIEVWDNWLATIAKRKMEGMLNLTPGCHEESEFESEYHISGVPRYIIIDHRGKIVTAYAPPPGGGMEEIIENTIKQRFKN